MYCYPMYCNIHQDCYSKLLAGEVYYSIIMRVVSAYSFCKELRDPISGARNPVRDELDKFLKRKHVRSKTHYRNTT